MHGRVNQRELAEAMLGAGVWFYPTWFSETSCITAMEAQAAGLWCVCPEIAALKETVREYQQIWTGDLAADAITAFNALPGAQWNAMMADRFSLDTLAQQWEARLNKLVTDVVPRFHEAAQ